MTARVTRVMQVTHDLAVGGLQRVVETLCTTIDRSRFEVAVLCVRDRGPLADRLAAQGVPVTLLERPRGRPDYLPFLRIARVLRAFSADVVHTHNTEPLIGAGIASLLAGTRTLVHTDHARPFPDKRRYMVMEHLLSYRAYRVVGVSDDTTRNLRRYERIPRRKLLTIENGIAGASYDVRIDTAAKRRALGIGERGPVIGLGARIEEQKGILYLLQALVLLRPRFPDITLLVAGTGSALPPLEQAARELGVADHVRFLGVRMDMPELLQLFDVYAMPSVWEGLPMALLEAMAAGCPVVASDVGGIPTALTDGVTGTLVPPRDPDALAAAIGSLLQDAARRDRYRAEARRAFRERFSAEAMTRRYEALYLRRGG